MSRHVKSCNFSSKYNVYLVEIGTSLLESRAVELFATENNNIKHLWEIKSN